MGCFDTYIIDCPKCGNEVEEQMKPGSMNTYYFGRDPYQDVHFRGSYYCHDCKVRFYVTYAEPPKMKIEVQDEENN